MEVTSSKDENGLNRLIDANLNRLSEGIRVCEDVARYLHDNQKLSKTLKELRHQCRLPDAIERLGTRDALNDVLRPSTKSEQQRDSLENILTANYHRAQESARVLEEFCKLLYPNESEKFKQIRYALYSLEKEHQVLLSALS